MCEELSNLLVPILHSDTISCTLYFFDLITLQDFLKSSNEVSSVKYRCHIYSVNVPSIFTFHSGIIKQYEKINLSA